ncbi:glycoprotein integral membrane protein 1 isoform X2 [Hemicordylus capensis]|uniref:glycoprotein integral membrane protein 1 isoform X2 n=1 Tax=Hemicordylus capensis TaxID=884348 RepID=UPI0023032460|nr:glycoprotein integral membrane protein 1 isoform X2 [Hemicordylus capensis]
MEAALGPRELLSLISGFLLLLPHCLAAPDPTAASFQLVSQESIKINVTLLESNGDVQERQVVLNITYINGQVHVNDFPLKSGVARIKCQTAILESGNSDSQLDQTRLGIVSVRIMVHEWPMASGSELQLIVVQEEVIDIDGKQVQQDEVTEIDILVRDLRVLRHSSYTVPLKESMLYSIPRNSDVLFTLPNIAGQEIESPLQTTSQYPLRQAETTVDEKTLPSKLPLTPVTTQPPSFYKESIKINVTVLQNNGDVQERQIVLNISYVNGQVYVNDFPLKSGVARIKCQTIILESGNSDSQLDQTRLGIVSVRIMVHEWPMASGSELQLIVVQEEVIDIDGKQVQQDEVTEIDILVKDLRVLRHSNYTVPLKESMLYSIPRNSDVLFTLPNIAGKEIESPLQTTSQYLLRQVETTVDEETLPGKLPETPLRTEPPSSYKVMCQWVEDLRKKLCIFWLQSFPVFFNFMEVIVVGVVGAALILKVLKCVCPSCEPKGIHLDVDVSVIPVVAISLLPDIPEKSNNIEKCI